MGYMGASGNPKELCVFIPQCGCCTPSPATHCSLHGLSANPLARLGTVASSQGARLGPSQANRRQGGGTYLAGGALGCLWLSGGLLILGNVGHGSLRQEWPRRPGTSAVSAPKMLQEAWALQAEEMPKGQVKSSPAPDPSWVLFPGVLSCRESLLEFASTPQVGTEGIWNCISPVH